MLKVTKIVTVPQNNLWLLLIFQFLQKSLISVKKKIKRLIKKIVHQSFL